jgi:hypothetical protein
MTENEARGYSMKNADEKADAALGRAEALMIVVVHMMRAISAGRTGEDAYRVLAEGLEADAENFKNVPMVQQQATLMQLEMLAKTFRGPASE